MKLDLYKVSQDIGPIMNASVLQANTAAWLDMKDGTGWKIIPDRKNRTYYENCLALMELNLSILPDIYEVKQGNNNTYVRCETIKPDDSKKLSLTYFAKYFFEHKLQPTHDWYKPSNMIANKIVDFHDFVANEERYCFNDPSNLAEKVYKEALLRYKKINRWKNTIYEGMYFPNFVMPGYKGDHEFFDSYRKLPFCNMHKENKRVLDLGCNQGFYSFQSVIHGAKHVDAIDMTRDEITTCKNIQAITGYSNIDFQIADAVQFVKSLSGRYDTTYCLSVLHQIYADMKGSACDEFLDNISKHTHILIYETPINHSKMKLSLSAIKKNLSKHFSKVDHIYTHDPYHTTGKRVIIRCKNKR